MFWRTLNLTRRQLIVYACGSIAGLLAGCGIDANPTVRHDDRHLSSPAPGPVVLAQPSSGSAQTSGDPRRNTDERAASAELAKPTAKDFVPGASDPPSRYEAAELANGAPRNAEQRQPAEVTVAQTVRTVFLDDLTDRPATNLAATRLGSHGKTGLNRTMTTGIVSNPDREYDGLRYLQTSAAINPGNSGGPVFDSHGRVIGLVSLKAKIEGAAFAIPASVLRHFLEEAVDNTR